MKTYISLFSGVGGLDLACDRAGMMCLAQVEKDEQARAVLEHHWPNVKKFEDVRNVGKHNLTTPDVLVGGFPCQDLSVAGRRKGLAGERSGLWYEFHRIIKEITPKWVVIENVPGLLSSGPKDSNGKTRNGIDFAIVLAGLTGRILRIPDDGWSNAGFAQGDIYNIAWRVLDAQFAGVPQRRRRIFVVAGLRTAGCNPVEILFESESLPGDYEPSRTEGQETPGKLGESVESDRFQRSDQYVPDIKTGALAARDFKSAKDLIVSTLAASGAGRSRPAGQANELNFLIPVQAIDLQQVTNPENCSHPTPESPTLTPKGRVTVIDVRNLTSNDDISGTIQSKNTGGWSLNYINPIAVQWNAGAAVSLNPIEISPTLQVKHPSAVNDAAYRVRRLTPVECARLQGFPDQWTAVNNQSDSAQYRQYGNAVAVPVAQRIMQRIMQVEWKALWNGLPKDIKEGAA